MLSVQNFLEGFVNKWETKKHSVDPDDSGNWYKGALVGSKYGVTGAALAKHRNVASVTKDDIASVTLAEAAAVARAGYYDAGGFDLLPWGPVVASAVDKAYLSGPSVAIACLQRACGVKDDGYNGPQTVAGVAKAAQDQEAFARRFADERTAHESRVIKAKPIKAKYRKGWINRTNSYLPGTAWWKSWDLDVPEAGDVYFPGAVVVPAPVPDTVSETAAANITELAKSMSRNTVNEVLAKAPASTIERVTEATKLKLGEKSTWVGGAIVVATTLADPTVQAAIRPTVQAIKAGNFGGILAGLIGLGLVIARSKATPRTDAVIAAKRLTGPG